MTSSKLDNEPSLSVAQAQAIAATKVYPRVTVESIKAKIRDVTYAKISNGGGLLGTLCVITLANGWSSTGFSAPADPRNFDAGIGERFAYEHAFRPLWQLEGYLLRERLYDAPLDI